MGEREGEGSMTKEEAIARIKDHKIVHKMNEPRAILISEALDMAIKALEQETKTGHWIDTGSGQMCSSCGEIQHGYDSFRRFCASCGIRMVEPQAGSEDQTE